MSEFEKKLIQGVYDSEWTGKVTGFRSYGGVREYPIQPEDQNVNPERGKQVTVFTEEGLAERDRQVAEKAWDEGRQAEELAWMHGFDGHPVLEGEVCDECRVVNPYRKERDDDRY